MSALPLLLALALFAQTPEPPSEVGDPAAEGPSAADYEIGPDDILRVTVYGHQDLSHTVVVQSDGTFIFPLVGRLKADGLTPKEVEQKLSILLGQSYIRNPQVTVVVQQYRSKVVYVVGEIAKPGAYPLAGSRTIVEVLSRAGPVTPLAGGEIVVVRPVGETAGPVVPGAATATGAEVIRVTLREIQAGNLAKNVQLRPNDTVFIPQAPRVFVSGEVRNPGAYPMASGLTVRQAISLAGGLTEDGSSGRIRVVREVEGKAREVKIKLDDSVLPGDTIVVKAKLF